MIYHLIELLASHNLIHYLTLRERQPSKTFRGTHGFSRMVSGDLTTMGFRLGDSEIIDLKETIGVWATVRYV